MLRFGNIFQGLSFITVALFFAISSPAGENSFLNLSSRGRVDSGENVLISGLVVETRSNVLIRGMGPSLGPLGVTHPLAHARLTLFSANGAVVATNDDWRLAIPSSLNPDFLPFAPYSLEAGPVEVVREVMQKVGAFSPAGFSDAAIYAELEPGLYTVHLSSADSAPGVGLLEIYLVPEAIDPLSPSGRVRNATEQDYAPAFDGLAPASPLPDTGARTLVLEYQTPVTWVSNGVSHGPFSTVMLPFEATGTLDVQHGRAGALDSRGWRISPRYAKMSANSAAIQILATPDNSARFITEDLQLVFDHLGSGTFTGTWGAGDGSVVSGSLAGTFHWTRTAPVVPAPGNAGARFFRVYPKNYYDGRSDALWTVAATDQGRVLLHGSGPAGSDVNGAREAVVTKVGTQYVLHYDGCAVGGWLACEAVSNDLVNWERHGPILPLGNPGSIDAATVASPWMIESAGTWYLYYLASDHHTGAPDYTPMPPYYTRLATGPSALGPWTKQPAVVPFSTVPGTYYAASASPGQVVAVGADFFQYFSAGPDAINGIPQRTLGLARTRDLGGTWTLDATELLPSSEQIENSSVYFDETSRLWFLFTNHVGINAQGGEYTDAIWMYWSADPTHFDSEHKAAVVDPSHSSWAKWVVGMPTVVKVGNRLAVLYDGRATRGYDHMQRDIGLAWLDLPLQPPF